jgi:hypothetical protein
MIRPMYYCDPDPVVGLVIDFVVVAAAGLVRPHPPVGSEHRS